MTKQKLLTPAKLTWQEATPVSVAFDDFYFSTDDGLNESRYVFLKPNNIPSRFIQGDLSQPLVIAETGFGTGLNFLNTWQAWKQLNTAKRPLHFFSIEKFPIHKEDLSKALSNWPELSIFIEPLLNQYPSLVPGLQTLEFESGQVRLSLLFGDVAHDLSRVVLKADVWYLDGFAPKKNPEMWTNEFFELIANKSCEGTTFSTFTSASIVRKSLSHAGFVVKKQEGFGKKREMVFGYYSGVNSTKPGPNFIPKQAHKNLWSFTNPELTSGDKTSLNTPPNTQAEHNHNAITQKHVDVAIIGSGLAGLATAYELAQQGLNVCIVESNTGPVKGASGQTQLAMYAKLPSEANKIFHFTIQALGGSFRFYQRLQDKTKLLGLSPFWNQTGLMQLAWNDKELNKQKSFIKNIHLPEDFIDYIDKRTASEKAGLDIDVDALWFEQAGWLDPIKYADAILSHTLISTCYNYKVSNLVFDEDQKLWELHRVDKKDSFVANYVVIANSNDAKSFTQVQHLPAKPLRGQVTSIKQHELKPSKTVICGEGYLCPPINDWHHFGATFDLQCDQPIIKDSDAEQNIKSLRNWLPNWLNDGKLETAEYHHSAGLRCTTPDYLPIVGQAPIADKMIQDFAKLRVDSNACQNLYGSYYPNLFVNIGHGSKGLFTTPLAAQIIRHHICGGSPPCLEEHRVMLSPARFLIKHLTQRRL